MKKTRAQVTLAMLAIGIIGMTVAELITLPKTIVTLCAVALVLGVSALMNK